MMSEAVAAIGEPALSSSAFSGSSESRKGRTSRTKPPMRPEGEFLPTHRIPCHHARFAAEFPAFGVDAGLRPLPSTLFWHEQTSRPSAASIVPN